MTSVSLKVAVTAGVVTALAAGTHQPPVSAAISTPTTRTVVLNASADTMVSQASPTSNYGRRGSLQADTEDTTENSAVVSYLRFSVPALGEGEQISSARLSIQATNGTTNGPAVWRTGATWSETGATWRAGRPARSGSGPVGNFTDVAIARVSTAVDGVIAPGPVSFELSPESSNGMDFASRESGTAASRPQLVLTVTTSTTTIPTEPSTPPEPTAPTAPGPAGTALPQGDLPGWRQTFVDDFTTDAPLGRFLELYGTRWKAYGEGWKDTSGNGVYSPSRVLSVKNGSLDYYVHTDNGVHYVAAPVPKVPTNGQPYGRYSVRFRADAIPGYKTAWLLWPDSDNWSDGEIDFPEGNLTSTIQAYSHCVGEPQKNCLAVNTGKTFADWHIATVEWVPGKVTFFLDGQQVGTTTSRVPTAPMHWVLQTETRLSEEPADSAAGHVQIDWVAAWSRS